MLDTLRFLWNQLPCLSGQLSTNYRYWRVLQKNEIITKKTPIKKEDIQYETCRELYFPDRNLYSLDDKKYSGTKKMKQIPRKKNLSFILIQSNLITPVENPKYSIPKMKIKKRLILKRNFINFLFLRIVSKIIGILIQDLAICFELIAFLVKTVKPSSNNLF